MTEGIAEERMRVMARDVTGPPVEMIMSTSSIPPISEYETLGLVFGAAVIARNIVSDLGATIKNATGGELKTYTALLEKAFASALERLRTAAEKKEADGVFAIRVATPQISAGGAEILLMGTAYKAKPDPRA